MSKPTIEDAALDTVGEVIDELQAENDTLWDQLSNIHLLLTSSVRPTWGELDLLAESLDRSLKARKERG